MKFGNTLGRLRQNAGFSQKKLAQSLKCDQSYLSKIESSRRKIPSRNTLLSISRILNLSEEQTDELLLSAQYQPQTIFEMDFEDKDFSLKKQIGVLKDLRENVPFSSYIKAREEIVDFLELLRLKYLSKTDETLTKRTLLADFIYAKVKRGGIKALYNLVNQPQGGAIVMHDDKILLAPIGISPLKGIWHIPAGFVNPEKGDKNAQDIALRLSRRYLSEVEIVSVKELTSEGESLENIDTTNFFLKLGFFPTVFQIFLIHLKENNLKPINGAIFCKFNEIVNLKGGIHPLLSQIIKPFVKNENIIKSVAERGEQTLKELIKVKNYKYDMTKFYEARIKKELIREN